MRFVITENATLYDRLVVGWNVWEAESVLTKKVMKVEHITFPSRLISAGWKGNRKNYFPVEITVNSSREICFRKPQRTANPKNKIPAKIPCYTVFALLSLIMIPL